MSDKILEASIQAASDPVCLRTIAFWHDAHALTAQKYSERDSVRHKHLANVMWDRADKLEAIRTHSVAAE